MYWFDCISGAQGNVLVRLYHKKFPITRSVRVFTELYWAIFLSRAFPSNRSIPPVMPHAFDCFRVVFRKWSGSRFCCFLLAASGERKELLHVHA